MKLEDENIANETTDGVQNMGSKSELESEKSTWRNKMSFFIFGLVNNIIYVMFMASAVDIMRGSSLPKSTVLLINIIPSMMMKLLCPCIIQIFPYGLRVWFTTICSISSLLITGLSKDIGLKLLGVAISSAGSGFGESCFLSLLSFYQVDDISCWSSGTGASGIISSLLYFMLTTILHLSLMHACLIFCIFPLLMVICYEFLLVKHSSLKSWKEIHNSQMLALQDKIDIAKTIFFPYLLPLLWVYFSEYLILGTIFVLVFPVHQTPFETIESEFRFYNLCVQTGVFISRSSLFIFRLENTWIPSVIQMINLVAFILDYLYRFIPGYALTCCAIVWVGMLGGVTYANTYANILSYSGLQSTHAEFAMAVVGISDSIGITLACIISVFLEPILCQYDYYCRLYQ